MKKPLALVSYENLLPGSQLINRLRDLGYRVQVSNTGPQLVSDAAEKKPLVILIDLHSTKGDPCEVIKNLRAIPDTGHIPILAFIGDPDEKRQTAAQAAGATMVALGSALLPQLPQLLARVLEVE